MNIMKWFEKDECFKKFGYVEISQGSSIPKLGTLIDFLAEVYQYEDVWERPMSLEDSTLRQEMRDALCEYVSLTKLLDLLDEDEQERVSLTIGALDSLQENDVTELLQKLAPEGYYYGSNSVNNSSFGYWKIDPADLEDVAIPLEIPQEGYVSIPLNLATRTYVTIRVRVSLIAPSPMTKNLKDIAHVISLDTGLQFGVILQMVKATIEESQEYATREGIATNFVTEEEGRKIVEEFTKELDDKNTAK